MGSTRIRSVDTPDETRKFENGVLEMVTAGSILVSRATFQPGWRWSTDVKPVAGTDLCQVHHKGYCVSGRLRVRTQEGTEAEIAAGDAYEVEPGHDGWVLGDEPWISVDFSDQMSEYTKPNA